jgi:hypothetical protein
MARRSRWQNFSDNFNSVYGTFNQLGKGIESKKVMNAEYTDDDGNALAGDALDRRRMMELSKVYTKYGDAEGGLGLRAQQAKIEASKRENDINQQIMQELIRQRGGLTTSQMESDIASTDANTADTRSTTNRRDALLPGEVDQQAATLDNTVASTDNTRSTTNRRDTLLPGEVDQQAATLDNTVASTDNTRSTTNRRDALLPGEVENQSLVNQGLGSANRSSAAQADFDEGTLESNIESTIAGNDASTADSNVKEYKSTIEYDQLDAEEQLLVELNQTEYDNPEDAEAAYRQMVLSDDRIAPERKAQIIRALDDTSLADLQGKATVMAQEGQNALQTGGLDGLVEYYDTIDDGDTMRIERNDDGTVSIVSTRGDVDTVLFTDSSADAEDVVTQQMFNQVSRPGTGFEVVVQAANVENTRQKTDESASRTSLLDSQKFSQILSQDTERARKMLLDAQVAKTRQDIEQAGRGLQGADLIAREGLADLQKSAEFIMLGDQRGGAALQAETLGNYMRVMGMADAPPAGVESQVWFSMTDEEKAAFQ